MSFRERQKHDSIAILDSQTSRFIGWVRKVDLHVLLAKMQRNEHAIITGTIGKIFSFYWVKGGGESWYGKVAFVDETIRVSNVSDERKRMMDDDASITLAPVEHMAKRRKESRSLPDNVLGSYNQHAPITPIVGNHPTTVREKASNDEGVDSKGTDIATENPDLPPGALFIDLTADSDEDIEQREAGVRSTANNDIDGSETE